MNIFIIAILIGFFVLSTGSVMAQSTSPEIPSPSFLESIGELISKTSGLVTPLAVVGFIFSIIYAGFVRMTAAGNPEKEAKSMKIAVSAAIGFAIIALAPLLVKILASLLKVDPGLVS